MDSWWLKVARAQKHLEELHQEVDAFTASQPYEAVLKQRPTKRKKEWVYVLRFTSQPTESLGVIAGDVLHNLRSSLDHIVCAMVPRARRRSAFFPIELEDLWAKNPNGRFVVSDDSRRERYESAIKGAPTDAQRMVLQAQPFQHGEDCHLDTLYMLSRLENADKHRQLIVLANGLGNLLTVVDARGETLQQTDASEWTGGMFPEGTPVARFGWTKSPLLTESEITVKVQPSSMASRSATCPMTCRLVPPSTTGSPDLRGDGPGTRWSTRCARVRVREGRGEQPSAAVLDSQSVPNAGPADEIGYDGGKRIRGRKRHVLVDLLGLLI